MPRGNETFLRPSDLSNGINAKRFSGTRRIGVNEPGTDRPIVKHFSTVRRDRDFSKLDIRDGVIHYKIRQQDGSFVPMTVKDTYEMRLFVEWVQTHD